MTEELEKGQATETEVSAEPVESAESKSTETEAPEESSQIRLDETGDLVIPDSFWGETKETEPETKGQEPQAAAQARYTPEELAEAFIGGNIDTAKLTPELAEYYTAINAAAGRRAEAERAQQERQRQMIPPVPPQILQPQPQPAQTQMSKESWAQLTEIGKAVAARNYLGIKPEEFDEFDPGHVRALNMAIMDVREQAQQMAQARQLQETQRAQAIRQVQARQGEVLNVVEDMRTKTPDFDEINEKFFPQWRGNLTVKEHEAVTEIMTRGTPAQVRDLITRVITDYRKTKEQPAKPKPAGAGVSTPPPVVSAGNAGGEMQGMADAAVLSGMSADDQVQWLIKNKFVA
jgi:hypothetical protein